MGKKRPGFHLAVGSAALLLALAAWSLGLHGAVRDPSQALYLEVSARSTWLPLSRTRTSIYLWLGADPERRFPEFGDATAFEAAASRGRPNEVRLMASTVSDPAYQAALASACERGDRAMIEALVEGRMPVAQAAPRPDGCR